MRSAGRSLTSRLSAVGLVTLIGAGWALSQPRIAHAFPFETFRWVWGDNAMGELGNNSDQPPSKPQLSFALPAGTFLTRIAAGNNGGVTGNHSLGMDQNRHVWAWGQNISGEAGDGGSGQIRLFAPVQVCAAGQAAPCSEFLGDVTAIAAGGLHSLAVDSFSNVWAWGSNQFGQLGSNVGASSPVPVRNNALFAQLHQVPGVPFITAVAAGVAHSLALDSHGVVWAWGLNSDGQLGLGSLNNQVFALPISFPEGEVITAIAAGTFHSLALDSTGSVWAWGSNNSGQLGISSFDARRNAPAKLIFFPSGTRIVAISGGSSHSLALDSNGNVFAWGANSSGQLGNGQTIEQRAPTQTIFPDGTPRIRSIAAGGSFNLAVDANRVTWAWGSNGLGQLGDDHAPVSSSLPVRASFPDNTNIFAIAAGGFHSLALETRLFVFDLEAVIDFDSQTISPRLLPESLTGDSVAVDTTSVALDRAGKKLRVTHSVTDAAGNTLSLVLTDKRKKPTAVALAVESVRYNGGTPLTVPKNRIKARWKTDTNGAIASLVQRVVFDGVDGVIKITTHYAAADNQTEIKVKTPAGKEQLTAAGMVLIQAATMNGALGFSDGQHLWR